MWAIKECFPSTALLLFPLVIWQVGQLGIWPKEYLSCTVELVSSWLQAHKSTGLPVECYGDIASLAGGCNGVGILSMINIIN